MSENKITAGVMARLEVPVGKYSADEHRMLADHIEEFGLHLNYDGNIVLHYSVNGPDYDVGLLLPTDKFYEDFFTSLIRAGVFIDQGTVKPFFCHWYDGSDPPHLAMSLTKAGYHD